MRNSIMLAAITMFGLASCVSEPVYREAESSNDFGYQETKLSQNQYTVGFKMRGENTETATDYAILRAAELTQRENMQWFVVTNHKTEVEREVSLPTAVPLGSEITRNCGLLGCATTVTYPVGTMSVTSYNETSEVDSYIHILMGNGNAPDEEDVYIASDVIVQSKSLENN